MRFTLFYRGELSPNSGPTQKHKLRQHFHRQLQTLWLERSMAGNRDWLSPPIGTNAFSILNSYRDFQFAPLVSTKVGAVAELSLHMLWPQSVGSIFVNGGDIDNRLKVLFDGLKMPRQLNEVPMDIVPEDGETPFHCLLEDDSLISKVTVQTDKLLEPAASSSEVCLFIHVNTINLNRQWKELP